jgi:hypothetical protein
MLCVALFVIFTTHYISPPAQAKDAGKVFSEKIGVDWNGDGRLDLLLGDQEGRVTVYLNEGSNDSPRYGAGMRLKAGGKDIRVKGPSAPCLVDWNEDGRKDLLVGDGGGYLYILLNNGTNADPVYASMAMVQAAYKKIDVRSKASPCVVDWNKDERWDLLLGAGNGELYLFLNEGTKGRPVFARPITINDGELDVGSDSSPDMADLDGDGKLDLIVGNHEGEILIFLNHGKEQEPQFDNSGSKILLRFNQNASPRVVRWRGSGLNDLIIADRYGEISLCLNKGSLNTPAFTEKRILRLGKR